MIIQSGKETSRGAGRRGRRNEDGKLFAHGIQSKGRCSVRILTHRANGQAQRGMHDTPHNGQPGHEYRQNQGAEYALVESEARRHETGDAVVPACDAVRSEEHTSELQSLMRISYAVFCLKKKNTKTHTTLS